jgi:hypothetical protein
MISVEDAAVYCKYFNRVFAIDQNYESEDYPYGEKDVTHWMFTFVEYQRDHPEKEWKRVGEKEFDVLGMALEHLEHRYRTFYEASMSALVDHVANR